MFILSVCASLVCAGNLSGAEDKFLAYSPKTDRDPILNPEEQKVALEAKDRALAEKDESYKKKMKEEEERLSKDNPENNIIVQGIIGKQAIIDGQVYSIGNKYMDARIVGVSANSVTFTYGG
ncbi:MAG: hypothetical protein NTW04_02255, partial [Elusimicrobia bacterium]|nr:hypothetical protein [Elusimicrobiota bacterium]